VYSARILVLIPHPDDEVVGCGIAIMRARQRGSEVFGVYLSNGIPARENDWPWRRRRYAARMERRWRESETVRDRLGLVEAARLDAPTRTLRFRLAGAEDALRRSIAQTRAETIWCPAFEGAHQDHDAANALGSRFADRIPVWEYATYNNVGGRTRRQEFPRSMGSEIVLDLTTDEQELKRSLLGAYASERANLRHIGTAREAFRPLPRYDYSRPPHDGTMFYARFRWVPFHPRVDRTDPSEVYRDLSAFLATPAPR
jgi:LmbE family N-acetylglucosaminyl deacetylase